jgi:hypothetical protein
LYEWFLNSHLLLSAVVLIAIWRHVSSKKSAELFLQIGICLWTVATVLHWVWFAFRNVVFGRPFATAVAKRLSNKDPSNRALVDPSNVLQVDITVPRPWQVEAGQSVFLSIPKLGVFTGLRGHPFMISWWERDRKGMTISLLVKSRAGFTAELDRHTNKPLRAFIDGPYGLQHNFGEYGTVIMFATGIGIAGHIPFIKDLVSGYNSCEVKTRHIRLVWEIKEKCEWWEDTLDSHILTNLRSRGLGQALDGQALGNGHRICTTALTFLRNVADPSLILDISIHVLQKFGKKPVEHGHHSRINEVPGPIDVVGTIEKEFENQRGQIMVSRKSHLQS